MIVMPLRCSHGRRLMLRRRRSAGPVETVETYPSCSAPYHTAFSPAPACRPLLFSARVAALHAPGGGNTVPSAGCWLHPRLHTHRVYGIGGGCPSPNRTKRGVRDTRHATRMAGANGRALESGPAGSDVDTWAASVLVGSCLCMTQPRAVPLTMRWRAARDPKWRLHQREHFVGCCERGTTWRGRE